MADGSPAEVSIQALVAAARDLVPKLAAGAADRDRNRTLPLDEVDLVRRAGVLAARVPKRFGGPGARFEAFAEITMSLSEGDCNIAQSVGPSCVMLELFHLESTETQKRRYYGKVLDGVIYTNAMAERGGKLVGDLKTTIAPDGDVYRINGTKFYCTGSLVCDEIIANGLMPDGSLGYALLPIGSAGVTIEDDWDGMGQRTTSSGTIRFDNAAVAPDDVIPAPDAHTRRAYVGAGFQLFQAAIDAGIARAALADALDYARTRARPVPEAGVTRQADDPYVISAIGEMAALSHGAEAMVRRAAGVVDQASDAQITGRLEGDALDRQLSEASIAVCEAKITATHAALRVSEMLFQVAGASASLRRYDLDRHWRNARTHTLHDPVSYKYRAVGDFLLNGRPPPISTKY